MTDTGVLSDFAEARFYDGWIERFESNSEKYIKPQDESVKNLVEVADSGSISPRSIGRDAWLTVYKEIRYELSKKWKTPTETISSGIGDCEDVTFLVASMLPNMGVTTSQVVLGKIIFPDGSTEYHTWNEVNGMVIDSTGSPASSEQVEYVARKSWDISVRKS